MGGIPPLDKWILSLVVFGAISQSAVRAVNDYFDRELDSHHMETDPFSDTRMLVHGHLIEHEVLIFAVVLHILGFILAGFMGLIFFLCFAVGMFLSYLYSGPPRIKGKFIINDLFIAIGYHILPIVAGFSLFKPLTALPWLLVLGLAGSPFVSGALKDFADVKRDKKFGMKNFVTILGAKKAAITIAVVQISSYLFIGILVVVNYLPSNLIFLLFFLIPYSIIFGKLIADPSEETGEKVFPLSCIFGIVCTVAGAILYVI